MAANIAIIAMTTSSSISVKPRLILCIVVLSRQWPEVLAADVENEEMIFDARTSIKIKKIQRYKDSEI